MPLAVSASHVDLYRNVKLYSVFFHQKKEEMARDMDVQIAKQGVMTGMHPNYLYHLSECFYCSGYTVHLTSGKHPVFPLQIQGSKI